jgi:hypothetical protein
MIIFGNRAFADAVKMRSFWINPVPGVIIWKGKFCHKEA